MALIVDMILLLLFFFDTYVLVMKDLLRLRV